MRYIILLTLLFVAFSSNAKLLDKVVAVVDDQVITLSMVDRISDNLAARRNISPVIYYNNKLTQKDIIDLIVNRNLVRARLTEMGYIISDDQVEGEIKATESRLGLTRKALLNFLESNNLTFNEYFEITRETIEFNFFNARIIRPLISVTEQEVKNTFYKKNIANKTLAFKYNLVDFSIPQNKMNNSMLKIFKNVLESFQSNGNLPKDFATVETNVLGDITEDGLTSALKNVLKKTDEGSFSSPILLNGLYHVFFVKKKDLVESEIFQEQKENIRAMLLEENANKMKSVWFQRESNKHYIKYFL